MEIITLIIEGSRLIITNINQLLKKTYFQGCHPLKFRVIFSHFWAISCGSYHRVSQKKVSVIFNFFTKTLHHQINIQAEHLIGCWIKIRSECISILYNVPVNFQRLTESEKYHWRLVSKIYAKCPGIKLILAKQCILMSCILCCTQNCQIY